MEGVLGLHDFLIRPSREADYQYCRRPAIAYWPSFDLTTLSPNPDQCILQWIQSLVELAYLAALLTAATMQIAYVRSREREPFAQ